MAPGAKKKNSNRRTIDNTQDGRKNFNTNFVDKQDAIPSPPVKERETEPDQFKDQNKRYNKRSVSSNWKKYEEEPIDPHSDTMRGKDFEVLLSYSGGSGSQLQLQDEKDWEEVIDEKTIALDVKDLVHVVKTIPFHTRLNLPECIFTEPQLSQFNLSAVAWKKSYTPIYPLKTSEKDNTMKKESSEISENLDSDLNIIYVSETGDAEKPVIMKPPIILEDKTESIIESLASCLSLKTPIPEKQIPMKEEVKKETQSFTDDLDFLLSLNVSLKNPVQEEKPKESEKTSIDDWLNSFLDD